jgi:hypothetical protein
MDPQAAKTPLLQDGNLSQAISNVRRRAERQDIEKLLNSFVDVGILQQLQNDDNQIVYGRRGTGKTHVLKVLASQAAGPEKATCYIDFRTLGSTAQFSDDTLSRRLRCTCLFRDILGYIHDALLDYFLDKEGTLSDKTGDLLDSFGYLATSFVRHYQDTAVNLKESSSREDKSTLEVSVAPSPKLSLDVSDRQIDDLEKTTTTQVMNEDKVIFPGISTLIARLLNSEKTKLLLLMDEWSSLPWDLQPYLAEFLKRAFFSNPSITMKIACLEQRSNFSEHKGHTVLGFEIGSDISASLDIDDYYVFDKDPENVTSVFADILFKHIKNELPYEYLEARYSIHNGKDLARLLYEHESVFFELVRASEGVARDLLNIFTDSYFAALRKKAFRIGMFDVRNAARKWFEQDKAPNLEPGLMRLLDEIKKLLISRRGLYVFCLPIELEKHEGIQRLVDARVVHLIHRGTSDEQIPGVRYTIFSLDYGCYAHLLDTNKQPELGFSRGGDFGKARQIKKFLIPREVLDEH